MKTLERATSLAVGLASLLVAAQASAQGNPLPPLPPDRLFDIGYTSVDGKPGDYLDEVSCYTNQYMAWSFRGYACESGDENNPPTPVSVWLPWMRQGMCRAASIGQDITLLLDLDKSPAPLREVLEAARPSWSRVKYIDLADEPTWTKSETEGRVNLVKAELRSLNLPDPPGGFGVTYSNPYVTCVHDPEHPEDCSPEEEKGFYAANLAWVGIEAYMDVGVIGPTPEQSRAILVSKLRTRIAHVPGDKRITLYGKAYASGGWENQPDHWAAIQLSPYDLAFDPDYGARVQEIRLFEYGRSNGTRPYHAVIQEPHKWMGERVLRTTLPAGCGALGAEGTCGQFDWMPPACAGEPPPAPGPYGLTVVGDGAAANLAWTNGQTPDSQKIMFSLNGGGYLPGSELGVYEDHREVYAPPPGAGNHAIRYCYKIRAFFGSQIRDSNEACTSQYNSPPTQAPHDLSPVGCASGVTPLFRWSEVPRATSYVVAISRDVDDELVIYDSSPEGEHSYLPSEPLQPGVRYHWWVKACNNAGCFNSLTVNHLTPACRPRADLDGDGDSDLLFRDPGTGALQAWYLDGVTRRNAADVYLNPPAPAGLAWEPVGTTDFDGDGRIDVLFRNSISGNLSIWFMDGVDRLTGATVTGLPMAGWTVAGTADFDGDRKGDIVWRQSGTANLVVWFMDGAVKRSESAVDANQPGYAGWDLVAVGDLNNDTRPDFIWREPSGGALVIWNNMAGPLPSWSIVLGALTPQTLPDANWRAVGIWDADHNGSNDLVWQNRVSGKLVAWFMEGGPYRTSGSYFSPDQPTPATLLAVGPR